MGGCYRGEVDEKFQIALPALVAPPGSLETTGRPPPAPVLVSAVVDTGANTSGISGEAVKRLMIKAIDTTLAINADGSAMQGLYHIDLAVLMSAQMPAKISPATMAADFKQFFRLKVVEFYDNEPMVLLGMDVIMQGMLEVKGSKFTFCL